MLLALNCFRNKLHFESFVLKSTEEEASLLWLYDNILYMVNTTNLLSGCSTTLNSYCYLYFIKVLLVNLKKWTGKFLWLRELNHRTRCYRKIINFQVVTRHLFSRCFPGTAYPVLFYFLLMN